MVYSRWPARRKTGARGLSALLTPQLYQHLSECLITTIPEQHAHGQHRLPTAAIQFQATVRPV